ncbi:hypothetical protein DPMN_148861 [Dreissena polymorpha]|uniref:Uncharacterized protein n=1 Tax=Dreissena polymorpha TaxID=45954 RepID=A0A9D4FEW6_DREPO|nr:hypothetical protein DPMN_148861 [Dreissena polymorpha]
MNSSTELQRIWERLDDRYRAPEHMYDAIKNELNNIPPKNKDPMRLYDLSNVVSEIEALKDNLLYSSLFSQLKSSLGARDVPDKLLYNLQQKWDSRAATYNMTH